MKHKTNIFTALLLAALIAPAFGQDESATSSTAFDQAHTDITRRLERTVEALNALREKAASETVPLSRKLSDLERELVDTRLEYQQTVRELDSATLELSNLRNDIKSRKDEASYLSGLLGEYIRNFESRLHIGEIQRYRNVVEEAKLAPENSTLSQREIFETQSRVLEVSLDRLFDALGGTRFEGDAVGPTGVVTSGTYLMVGPAALFGSLNGDLVGTAEQRLGSLEPSLITFKNAEDTSQATRLLAAGAGYFPLDPSLGNAHVIEDTEESFIEHIQKGGVVMYPIFTMAGLALLVALLKWLGMAFIRKPPYKRIRALLDAVSRGDKDEADSIAKRLVRARSHPLKDWRYGAVLGALCAIGLFYAVGLPALNDFLLFLEPYTRMKNGLSYFIIIGALVGVALEVALRMLFNTSPSAEMLHIGVNHLDQPAELIEELMFEKVLLTRLKLQRFLPLIAISAASAPLLGLLGTVTGIINTFKLITVFGSGDVKTLSGGISEALITTEFGLIVAIPSLLLHALLSRKARGIVDDMEKTAVSFTNEVSIARHGREKMEIDLDNDFEMSPEKISRLTWLNAMDSEAPVPETVETPDGASDDKSAEAAPVDRAADLMRDDYPHIGEGATVSEALAKLKEGGAEEDFDALYVVDGEGKYQGHVLVRRLITRAEDAPIADLIDKRPCYVRANAGSNEIDDLFSKNALVNLPVLDEEDGLVGRVVRNGKGEIS